jgi:outer membrane protein assembly factor BamD (BamD/ComL family)
MGLGKADDSPAAQMKFIDMYSTANRDMQDNYNNYGQNTAYQYIQNAAATNPIDTVALQQSISDSIQNHYDQAEIQQAKYMGDPYNYRTPTYNMPEPLSPVENNVSETTQNANDQLDDED